MSGAWATVLRTRKRAALIGLFIGALAFAAALAGVPLAEVGAALRAADPLLLLPPAALFLVQQAVRALRQAELIRGALPHHRFRDSHSVLCISFLFINALPARLGELVRPPLLLERAGVPLGVGFAVVFVERVIDFTSMLLMIDLVATFVPVPSHTLVLGGLTVDWVAAGRTLALTTAPLLLGAVLTLILGGERLVAALQARLLPRLGRLQGVGARVLGLCAQFVAGMATLRDPARLLRVLALTGLTWLLTALLYLLVARAFGLGDLLDLGEAFGLLGMTMAGMAVPSAPGMAGTYEAALRAALALFGLSGPEPLVAGGPSKDALAVAYTLVYHWGINGVQALSALVFLIIDRPDLARLGEHLRRSLGGGPLDPPQPGGVNG